MVKPNMLVDLQIVAEAVARAVGVKIAQVKGVITIVVFDNDVTAVAHNAPSSLDAWERANSAFTELVRRDGVTPAQQQ